MRFALILSLMLAACGGGEDVPLSNPAAMPAPAAYDPASDNHRYGWHFNAQGPRGLKLRYPAELADHPLSNPALFEAVFDEVQNCTGLYAPMIPFLILTLEGSRSGLFFSNPYLVVADSDVRPARHEMVHYLLHYNTGNAGGYVENGVFVHTSPLFARDELCQGA